MKERGDVFKQFRDSFNDMKGHFHILEQRVPVELQMEYFKYSEKLRKSNGPLTDNDFESIRKNLWEPDPEADNRRYLLTSLAISREVKAYRLLEEYVEHPQDHQDDSYLHQWACLALMESRITLESELSDEKQIYISTGLGGRGEKLRFFVLMLSEGNQVFQDYQRQVIEREFAYNLPLRGCEIERLTVEERHVEMIFLIPVRADIRGTLDGLIHECNQYGHFLSPIFTITNVKELSQEEITELINKHGDSKAGN